jgi:hypothetical protein
VTAATGLRPEVIGKPEPALFEAALAGLGPSQSLVVGDRLDTDIVGANKVGLHSLLVLSGVSRPRDLVLAGAPARPCYLGRDLQALDVEHPATQVRDGVAHCGGATAMIADGAVTVEPNAHQATPDQLDPLRAVCALAWSVGSEPGTTSWASPFISALRHLGLD